MHGLMNVKFKQTYIFVYFYLGFSDRRR